MLLLGHMGRLLLGPERAPAQVSLETPPVLNIYLPRRVPYVVLCLLPQPASQRAQIPNGFFGGRDSMVLAFEFCR